jgi:hypothetical protein
VSARERRKGAGFENEICSLLRERLGTESIRRNLAQSRGGRLEGCDITVGSYSLECKRRATLGVYQWLDQARRDCGKQTPVVVARADGRQAIAILDFEAFVTLLQGEL